MAFAQDIRALLHSVRAIPGQFGLRPHTVHILAREWDGPHTGDGEPYDQWTAITHAGGQPPKVRWVKDDEVAVGNLHPGTIEVGPLTPETAAQIAVIRGDALPVGATRYLRIAGPSHPNGANYEITRTECDRAMQYKLQAKPVGEGDPSSAPTTFTWGGDAAAGPGTVTPFVSVDGAGFVQVDAGGFIEFHEDP